MEETKQEVIDRNTEWTELTNILDRIADSLQKNKATPTQALLASLMVVATVINNNVKKEILEDKEDYLSQVLVLSEKILEKSGITRR